MRVKGKKNRPLYKEVRRKKKSAYRQPSSGRRKKGRGGRRRRERGYAKGRFDRGSREGGPPDLIQKLQTIEKGIRKKKRKRISILSRGGKEFEVMERPVRDGTMEHKRKEGESLY